MKKEEIRECQFIDEALKFYTYEDFYKERKTIKAKTLTALLKKKFMPRLKLTKKNIFIYKMSKMKLVKRLMI